MDKSMMMGGTSRFDGEGTPLYGSSPMNGPNPGYDNAPEAKLAILSNQFKGSSREHRRAIFNEAFRTARRAGLQEFELGGKRYTTKLAEEVVRDQAKTVAKAAIQHIANNEGVVHENKTKADFDMMQTFGMTPPSENAMGSRQRGSIREAQFGGPNTRFQQMVDGAGSGLTSVMESVKEFLPFQKLF